jgi:hypothetical protein
MLFGFNLRTSDESSLGKRRGSLRAEPGRLLKGAGSDFRRSLSVTDVLLIFLTIFILVGSLRCFAGDCSTLELVIRLLIRPVAGGLL